MSGCDPNYSDLVLLLPPVGPDMSTAFPDQSPAVQTVTTLGAAVVSTDAPFLGTFSAELPSGVSPASELEVTDATSLLFATGDWTVEFFYKRGATTDTFFLTKTNFDSRFPYFFQIDVLGIVHVESADTAGTTIQSRTATVAIPIGTWTHVVYERNGSNFRLYVAGVEILTGLVLTPFAGDLGDNGAPVRFTGPTTGTASNLAQVRFSKGIARYAAGNFTPPTEAFPTIACTAPPTGTINVFGKFVSSPVFVPIMLANPGKIKPKIYMPLENTTIRGNPA